MVRLAGQSLKASQTEEVKVGHEFQGDGELVGVGVVDVKVIGVTVIGPPGHARGVE